MNLSGLHRRLMQDVLELATACHLDIRPTLGPTHLTPIMNIM
jgi:hypothetical protein